MTNLILDMSKKQCQLSLLGIQNFLHHPNVHQGHYTKEVNFELVLYIFNSEPSLLFHLDLKDRTVSCFHSSVLYSAFGNNCNGFGLAQ